MKDGQWLRSRLAARVSDFGHFFLNSGSSFCGLLHRP